MSDPPSTLRIPKLLIPRVAVRPADDQRSRSAPFASVLGEQDHSRTLPPATAARRPDCMRLVDLVRAVTQSHYRDIENIVEVYRAAAGAR